jgi:peptidoglycan hydrolase CwlO-like protein
VKAYKRPQFQDGANVMDVFEYDPYDQFQQLIAQCNENTRMIHKLIESHNKLDSIVMELTAQHSRTTELLVRTRTDIGTITDELIALRSADFNATE